MMGDQRKEDRLLISAPEIVKLAVKHSTVDAMYIAEDVAEAFRRTVKDPYTRWNRMLLQTVIFEAGRIQGIREERAKKKR